MDAFTDRLARQLAELHGDRVPSGYAIAYSGGLDSTVLLAACQRLNSGVPLRALHVNHHIHPEAEAWARHCAAVSDGLGVALETIDIAVDVSPGQSLEAEARARRYAALAGCLRRGEMLLTAHHEDDQLETVLMRLFRGAGVKGLRGILARSELGPGLLGRPLLKFPKAELVVVARAWDLVWIEDPSNADQRFDRNYLRNSVLPAIRRRWPGVARTVGRAARQMVEAEMLLETIAMADAESITDLARIPMTSLRQLDPPRQRNLLRFAVSALGLPLPTADQLNALVGALDARPDTRAVVCWPGAEAHVHAEQLHLIEALPAASPVAQIGRLTPEQPWTGPEGQLALVEAAARADRVAMADDAVLGGLDVRFRRGGEQLKPAFDRHHRKLKKLLQEAGIVPWMRSRIPLLYRRDELVAVGDLWVSDTVCAQTPDERAWRVRWTDHPALR